MICKIISSKFNDEELLHILARDASEEADDIKEFGAVDFQEVFATSAFAQEVGGAAVGYGVKQVSASAKVDFREVSTAAIDVQEELATAAAAGYGVKKVSIPAKVDFQKVSTAATDVQEELAAIGPDLVDAEELPFAAKYFGVKKDSDVVVLDEGTCCHLSLLGEDTTPIREALNSNFDLYFDDELSNDIMNMWVQSLMNHNPPM